VSARPIGWQVTATFCRACVPEGISESGAPMREGDDYGVPYRCDTCGEKLLPCDHAWGEWMAWWQGGEWRACENAGCEEIERREVATEATL
jgi:hypothetical protein